MKMPKLKTHSGAKKRFKLSGRKKKNGPAKVIAGAANRRHKTSKRPRDMMRQSRGTMVLFETDGVNVRKHYLPNSF
jgi:large subunit ribosomal protein L35